MFCLLFLTTISKQFRQIRSVSHSMVCVLKRMIAMLFISSLLGLSSPSWANLSADSIFLKAQSAVNAEDDNAPQKIQQLTAFNQQPVQINQTQAAEKQQSPKAQTLIGQLAQSGYALMFFFDSKCPHCHNFAPIVKSVSANYGFHVFDFSFDNQGLPSFPTPATVTQAIYHAYYGNAKPFYPVLILQNVNTMDFYVIAQGEVPEALLLQNLNQYAKELLHA